MKKKILAGLGIFFGLIVVAIVAAVIYFWPFLKTINPELISFSNIKALYIAFTQDEETVNAQLRDIDDKRSEEIKEYVSMDIRDFTEEELERIEKGETTKTQVVAQIIAESATENTNTAPENGNETVNDAENNQNSENGGNVANGENNDNSSSAAQVAPKETADQIVARHIANLYAYYGEFEGRVNNLASTAKSWLHAYKKAHPGITWHDAKVATMQHFMDTATQIENDCYAKVDAEIASMEQELIAIGADLSVVKTVRESAYSEIELKKSQIVKQGMAKMNKE